MAAMPFPLKELGVLNFELFAANACDEELFNCEFFAPQLAQVMAGTP